MHARMVGVREALRLDVNAGRCDFRLSFAPRAIGERNLHHFSRSRTFVAEQRKMKRGVADVLLDLAAANFADDFSVAVFVMGLDVVNKSRSDGIAREARLRRFHVFLLGKWLNSSFAGCGCFVNSGRI